MRAGHPGDGLGGLGPHDRCADSGPSSYAFTLVSHAPFAAGLAFAPRPPRRARRLDGPRWPPPRSSSRAARPALARLRADRPIAALARAARSRSPTTPTGAPRVASWPAPPRSRRPRPALRGVGLGARRALGAYVAALAVAVYGVFVRRRWVRVRTLDVADPGPRARVRRLPHRAALRPAHRRALAARARVALGRAVERARRRPRRAHGRLRDPRHRVPRGHRRGARRRCAGATARSP